MRIWPCRREGAFGLVARYARRQPYVPLEVSAQVAGFARVMLWAERIGVEMQEAVVHLDAVAGRRLAIGKVHRGVHHPAQCNIREPRFIFGVATADVGVVSGEPYLL